ncbi:MAG: RNA polymerase sigma factor [Candidatus Dormibacteria bacterium]
MDSPKPLLHVVDAEIEGGSVAHSWETIYRDWAVPVYRFVFSRVGNRADAEDLTTGVFERALPRLRDNAVAAEVGGYLFATARTVLADHWRDGWDVRTTELPSEVHAPPLLPLSSAAHHLEVEGRARAILDALPDNYRRVLELRFLRGFSIRETAAHMGVTVANAKVLQHRALRRAAAEDGPA